MTDKIADLFEAVEKLIIETQGFEELEAELSGFCPFEAMGVVSAEIRHSNFLSYILDPNRPHGFGDHYLRAFLHVLAENYGGRSKSFRPMGVHLAALGDARILRERDRIDLRIELRGAFGKSAPDIVVICEIKINASESEEQLSAYKRKMDGQYPNCERLYFFLTLSGEEARKETDRKHWWPVSLSDIVSKFERIANHSLGEAQARQFVHSYLEMMRRAHLPMERSKLQEISKELWSRHRDALQFLADNQPDNISDLLKSLFEEQHSLCQELSELTELEFEPDRDSREGEIIVVPKDWDEINTSADGRRIYVLAISRIYRDPSRVKVRWMMRNGNPEQREVIYNAIPQKKKKLTGTWTQICSENIDVEGIQVANKDFRVSILDFVRNNISVLLRLPT